MNRIQVLKNMTNDIVEALNEENVLNDKDELKYLLSLTDALNLEIMYECDHFND